MTVPKVIVKNGKRYVKIGKKRIKVDSSLTERELIQWMIKHFKPKRRVKKSAIKDGWVAPPPSKAIVLPVAPMAGPSQVREAKEQLESTQKLEKESEDKFKKIAEDAKKATPPAGYIKERDVRAWGMQAQDHVNRLLIGKDDEIKELDAKIKEEQEAANQLQQNRQREQRALDITKQEKVDLEKQIKLDALKRDFADKEAAYHRILRGAIEDEMTAARLRARARAWNERGGTQIPGVKEEGAAKNIKKATLLAHPVMQPLITDDKLEEELLVEHPGVKKAAEDRDEAYDKIREMTGLGKAMAFPVATKDIPAEGISDLDINRAMKDHRQFLGAIAADEIHSLKPGNQKRIGWIQNTEPRAQGGAHWVAFFIDARPHGTQSVEYYDPLGDPITPGFLRDVKVMIKAVHGNDSYLKFRQNAIPDQSDTSNNCGPFAIRFLQARLAGESFAKASGWDQQGEKNIALWKKHPKQQTWISGQTGEGLRDIFAAVRKGATKIYERIKATLSGPRGGAPPAVRGWLAKYGDVEIQNVWVCKKPIFSILESIANWFSQGKLRENMDRLGYDRLMHLYMIVELKGGPTVKIEKEHVVSIKNSGDLGQKHMSTGHPPTVNAMLKAAEAGHGEAVWKYHLVDANCQKFIMWCLGSKASEGVREFVMQNVEESLKDMGLLKKIATIVTDVAGAADVAINGAGTVPAGK